ncbi:MAG: class I SAM-dependent methyltransferase [Planctomycetota bacterium]
MLSSPEDYAEEAQWYRQAMVSAGKTNIRSLLELGSGGGNNASHLKKHFQMTLVDLSTGMLDVSRKLNPECEHIQGDMRSVRLGRQFDAVFVHDAVSYMTSEKDLRSVIETAYEHCARGGVALFAPDHTREAFRPSTSHGGHDEGVRGLRYLEWTWDGDPTDTTYSSHMVYVIRFGDGRIQVVDDMHTLGLFGKEDWLRMMAEVGFEPSALPFEHSEIEPGSALVFLGLKPCD